MGRDPALRGGDRGVAVVARRVEDLERRLSVAVPLDEHEARERVRGGRADVAGDQVEREVVPRGRRAGGDEPAAIGDHQRAVRAQVHRRVAAAERGLRDPVDGRLVAVEQAGLGDEQPARAGRADRGAAGVHGAEPRGGARPAARSPVAVGAHLHRRHDHDVGRRHLADAAVHREWEPGRGAQRSGVEADDLDRERRLAAAALALMLRHRPDVGQELEQPAHRRGHRVGRGEDAHVHGRAHGTNGPVMDRPPLAGAPARRHSRDPQCERSDPHG